MNSLIVFGLDRSGSMEPALYDTIRGFNEFLRLQQYRIDDCEMLLMQFGRSVYVTREFVSIYEVPPLDGFSYHPGDSSTSLFDFIMDSCALVDKKLKTLPKEQHPAQVTFVIQTDGEDSGSVATRSAAITEIKKRRGMGWQMIFLATGSPGIRSAQWLEFPDSEVIPYQVGGDATANAFDDAGHRILESVGVVRGEV